MGRFINETTRDLLKVLAYVGSMGLAMVLAIVIGLCVGVYVDKKFGCGPWGFFIGLLFGIAAGFRNLWVIAKKTGFF